ncbi:MAG TPA: isoprenylcysteine carboxylmethyltransferase family protein, partial [Pyrinomonadaceae bacterium]|nr:isoprenylcysteine carboxylmethyltransferase family protein [Pyrinomonadaceae bacterium]
KKPEAAPDKVKVPKSFWGIALQGVSFGLVWALHRTPVFSPFVASDAVNVVLQVFAVLLSINSVWLSMSAIRELGKQWSFQARLIEDHQLVTSGVYGLVRHPIYTAMLGKLIATGIVLSHWAVVLGAVVIFLIGTTIRTRLEEHLLAGAFGASFEKWKARVPALIPGLKF